MHHTLEELVGMPVSYKLRLLQQRLCSQQDVFQVARHACIAADYLLNC